MARKKPKKKTLVKKTVSKAKATKSSKIKAKGKSKKSKNNKVKEEPFDDLSIVIVDDDITIDQEKINEERRAYLEEARSQEASD